MIANNQRSARHVWMAFIVIMLVVICCSSCLQATSVEAQEAKVSHELNKTLSLDLGGGVKMELVLIPAGAFIMGDDKSYGSEIPAHKVTITKPFYIGTYEVTQEQWQALMGNNPSATKGPTNPVEQVSWDDRQAFLKKLNERIATAGVTARLPTEAQWEYACRAGTTTRFCFGDNEADLGEYGWFKGNAEEKTHPVGQKKPNAWGLYDMHGNVWEWCADWYDENYYSASPPSDPTGPSSGSSRVIRGGGWLANSFNSRTANRNNFGPTNRDDNFGVRVVCEPR